MANKRSLSFVELHFEKMALGAAAAFTLGIAVYAFLIGPNKVAYREQTLGPGDLAVTVQQRAEALKSAVARAHVEVQDVPAYAEKLARQIDGSLFDTPTTGPALPPVLAVCGPFGKPLEPIKDDQQEKSDIVLVTPLRPSTPVISTGRSVVQRRQAMLAAAPLGVLPTPEPAKEAEPVELSWLSIASYVDKAAEQLQMGAHGYASHRAIPYIVGVDLQRQERLPSGEFGPWTDVKPCKAVPQLDLPRPVFDPRTGNVLNQDKLDQTFEIVKNSQEDLFEPDFYMVDAGDDWIMPPLPGHEPEEEEDVADTASATPKGKKDKDTPVAPPRTPPGPGGYPGGPGGYPGGPGGYPGGPGGYPGGPGGYPGGPGGYPGGPGTGFRPPTGGVAGQGVAAARREITKNLNEARKAMRKKDYASAQQFAGMVANHPQATKGQKRQAQDIVKTAQLEQQKAAASGGPKPPPIGRPPIPGPWAGGPMSPTNPAGNLITDPASDGSRVAAWTHDDSVVPGKTYRYRLRVKLWNRYVGRRAPLLDKSQADEPVIAGEWSLPSDPVVVAPTTHFFAKGPKWGEPAASVDVFTWHKGAWLKESFDVRIGDVIGGVKEVTTGEDEDGKALKESVDFSTGAIVLDVRPDEPVMTRQSAGKQGEFNYRDLKTLVLVYLDPADGQVKERVASADRTDRTYKKLKEEVEKTATP